MPNYRASTPAVLERLSQYGFGENVEFSQHGKLRIDKLEIPPEFQRKLRPRNWSQFVPALFGRITVAEVNGHFIVVDGQHRLDEADGWEVLPATLFRGVSMRDAAAMFDLYNSERVALRAADEFRAACVSENDDALALDAALLARGLDGWCQGRAETDLGSIASVRTLEDQLGLDHTLYTMDFISDVWPWPQVEGSPHVRIVRGVGQFLRSEKKVTGRKRPRKWNPAERDMLVNYLALFYPQQDGMESSWPRRS